jgi:hypothetical protein
MMFIDELRGAIIPRFHKVANRKREVVLELPDGTPLGIHGSVSLVKRWNRRGWIAQLEGERGPWKCSILDAVLGAFLVNKGWSLRGGGQS